MAFSCSNGPLGEWNPRDRDPGAAGGWLDLVEDIPFDSTRANSIESQSEGMEEPAGG